MAKKATMPKSSQKVTFGKRRIGKHAKRLNKHASKGKPYIGQGR